MKEAKTPPPADDFDMVVELGKICDVIYAVLDRCTTPEQVTRVSKYILSLGTMGAGYSIECALCGCTHFATDECTSKKAPETWTASLDDRLTGLTNAPQDTHGSGHFWGIFTFPKTMF